MSPIALISDAHGTPAQAALSLAIARGVRAPLAALRASLESFERAFDPDDPRVEMLESVRAELVRITHNVQALAEYACPAPAFPLDCTLEEIVDTTLASLSADLRGRVLTALEQSSERVAVDGPRLAQAFAHRIEWALARSSEPVLLSARGGQHGASFHLVHDAALDSNANSAIHPTLAGASGLYDLLSTRDFALVGARTTTRRTARGLTELELRFAVCARQELCA